MESTFLTHASAQSLYEGDPVFVLPPFGTLSGLAPSKRQTQRLNHFARRETQTANGHVDTSSVTALWNSLAPPQLVAADETEEGGHKKAGVHETMVGTIERFDPQGGVFVRIWMKGDDFQLQTRPVQKFPLSRIQKMKEREFNAKCKKPFMRHKSLQLALKGGGHDEDMPISLIAYNNEIVNQLLNRSYKKNARQGLGPGLDSDFSEIRKELRQLNPRARRTPGTTNGEKSTNAGKDSAQVAAGRLSPEERAERSFVLDRSRILTTPPTAHMGVGAPPQQPHGVSKAGARGHGVGQLLKMASERTADMIRGTVGKRSHGLHSQMSQDPLLRYRPESQSGTHTGSPTHSGFGSPHGSTLTMRDTMLASFATAAAMREMSSTATPFGTYRTERCTAMDVEEEGEIIVRAEEEEGNSNGNGKCKAVLEGVVVPHSFLLSNIDPRGILGELIVGKEIEVTHCGINMQRSRLRLDVERAEDGLWIQAALVEAGAAYVEGSLLQEWDNAGESPTAHDGGSSSSSRPRMDKRKAEELLDLQARAQRDEIGIWATENSSSSWMRLFRYGNTLPYGGGGMPPSPFAMMSRGMSSRLMGARTTSQHGFRQREESMTPAMPANANEGSRAQTPEQETEQEGEDLQGSSLAVDNAHMDDVALPSLFDFVGAHCHRSVLMSRPSSMAVLPRTPWTGSVF